MTKPPLGKVEALLYVLQHVTQKRMCQNFDTPPKYYTDGSEDQNPALYLSLLNPESAARNIAYFIWGEEIK